MHLTADVRSWFLLHSSTYFVDHPCDMRYCHIDLTFEKLLQFPITLAVSLGLLINGETAR